MLHLDKHIQCAKKTYFSSKYFSLEVWCGKLKRDISLLWLVLKASEVLSLLLLLLWKQLWGKIYFWCCLYLIVCFFVTTPGRSSSKRQSLNIKLIHLYQFPANTEQAQQSAAKTNFIITSMSCFYSSTGPHVPLWCLLLIVMWNNLLWWCMAIQS